MISRDELLARVGAKQVTVQSPQAKPLRIILEFAEPRISAPVTEAIRDNFQIATQAALLSEAHGHIGDEDGSAHFIAVTVIGIEASDVADSPFELGYAFADVTGALTAEPELGTDFYFVPRTDNQLESVDELPLGCWVDAREDPTPEQPHWAVKKIKATDAWTIEPKPGGKAKGEDVLVFQPDVGVADHAELKTGTALAYDFIENKKGAVNPMDYNGSPGHSTGTASVEASRSNGKVARSAPLATLVPVRALTSVAVFDHGRRSSGGRICAAQPRQHDCDEPRRRLEQRIARRNRTGDRGRGSSSWPRPAIVSDSSSGRRAMTDLSHLILLNRKCQMAGGALEGVGERRRAKRCSRSWPSLDRPTSSKRCILKRCRS